MKQEIIEQLLEGKDPSSKAWKNDNSLYQYMEEYEQANGVDFDRPDKEDFFGLLGSQNNIDIATLRIKLQSIRRYVMESCPEHEAAIPDAFEFDLSKTSKMRLVPSLEEIYSRLSLAYSPDDGDAIYPLCSFAWMGLSFKDAIKVKAEEVDLSDGIIHYNAPMIFEKMPANMIDILKRCRSVKSVRRENRKIEMPDGRPEFIYKMVSSGSKRAGSPIYSDTKSMWLEVVKEKYNKIHVDQIDMGYQDIVRSAKFYKMRQMELDGVDWSLRSNSSLLRKVYMSDRAEIGDIRYNYEMYKKAFGLK